MVKLGSALRSEPGPSQHIASPEKEEINEDKFERYKSMKPVEKMTVTVKVKKKIA